MSFPLLHQVEHGGKHLAFDGRSYAIIKTTLDGHNALAAFASQFNEHSDCKDQFDNCPKSVAHLFKAGTLSLDELEYDVPNDLSKLTLILTFACNLRCAYCFEGRIKQTGVINFKTAAKAVDYLLEHSTSKTVNLHFFGGEPLLCTTMISKIIKYANKTANEHGRKINYFLTTNGTLITHTAAALLAQNHIHVQVSLDGCKEGHDALRKTADGKGSYDRVVAGIEMLKEYEISYSIFAVANKHVLKTSTKWLSNLALLADNNFDFRIAADNNEDKCGTLTDINRSLMYYEDYIRQKTCDYKSLKHGILSVSRIQDWILSKKHFFLGCNAGSEAITVLPDGCINLCERLTANTHLTIFDIPLLSEIQQCYARSVQSECCMKCWAKHLCGGGCQHEAQKLHNGEKPPWWHCSKRKIEATAAIKILANAT